MPLALSIGVDYQLFWRLTPRKLDPFIRAARMKDEQEAKTLHYTAWLHGLYVNRAIASVFPEGSRYPKAPLEEEKKMNPADRFRAVAAGFNVQFQKKEGK